MKRTRLILLVLFAVLPFLVLSYFISTPIEFREFNTTDVIQIFALLLLVSVFLERALEVFLSTWRGPGAAILDLEIERSELKIHRLNESVKATIKDVEFAINDFEKAKEKRENYRCISHRYILWIGLAFGFFVSAIGLQVLHSLADSSVINGLPRIQQTMFKWVDVLLTGGVIAGGSEGIHKIANVYDNFMKTTAKSAADKK